MQELQNKIKKVTPDSEGNPKDTTEIHKHIVKRQTIDVSLSLTRQEYPETLPDLEYIDRNEVLGKSKGGSLHLSFEQRKSNETNNCSGFVFLALCFLIYFIYFAYYAN